MRHQPARRQWEHTDEEESLVGMAGTDSLDMPPSLRRLLAADQDSIVKLRRERDTALQALKVAREALEKLDHEAHSHYDDARCGLFDGGLADAMDAARDALAAIAKLVPHE